MDSIKKFYKNIISFLILIGGFTYLFINAEVHHLSQFDWRLGVGLIILQGCYYFLTTLPQYFILNNMNLTISFGRIFSITILTNFLNLLLPARGGVLFRGFILNKYFKMKKRDYMAFSLFISLSGLFIMGIFGLILFPLMDSHGEKPLYLLEGGAAFLVLLGFYGLYSTKALAKWNKRIAKLYHQKTKWSLINTKKNFILTSFSYGGSFIVHAMRIYLLGAYFFLEIDLINACALTVLLLFINTIPILPGNIGVKEASLSGILALMGHNPQIGFFIGLLDRLMELIFLGVFGTIFSFKWNIWSDWRKSDVTSLRDD